MASYNGLASKLEPSSSWAKAKLEAVKSSTPCSLLYAHSARVIIRGISTSTLQGVSISKHELENISSEMMYITGY
jgi:hypothetical protein